MLPKENSADSLIESELRKHLNLNERNIYFSFEQRLKVAPVEWGENFWIILTKRGWILWFIFIKFKRNTRWAFLFRIPYYLHIFRSAAHAETEISEFYNQAPLELVQKTSSLVSSRKTESFPGNLPYSLLGAFRKLSRVSKIMFRYS